MSGVGRGRGVDGRGGDATLQGVPAGGGDLPQGQCFPSGAKQRSTLRETEWEDVMLWAEREPDGVVVVHAEFWTAASLSCEMRESDGVWRTLMR